ncbi:hypothetical protein MMC14_004196 [Varicellaria rhodocarpa]|nr:hypothetical protein [Varicellaria rhodocarpa]
MEELQKRHHAEQRDLQSRITQKKKSATKKTRKGVNDECAELKRRLKEKHDEELSLLQDPPPLNGNTLETVLETKREVLVRVEPAESHIENSLADLSLQEPATQQSGRKPNRQKARLARRAAEQEAQAAKATEEASNLPDLREQERLLMSKELQSRGLTEKAIRSDGHCLYAAIADQLIQMGVEITGSGNLATEPAYRIVRHKAAAYISHHATDFSPFLEEDLEDYVVKIKDTGEWGGELELSALAREYDIEINVLQGNGRVEKIVGGPESEKNPVWLAYYRHSFGLGEHYNSLRKSP